MVTKSSLEEFNDVFLTAERKMPCFEIHSRLGNFLRLIRYIFTLGARGFSCANSGFSQVLRSDPLRRCLRPSAEHVSACGRRDKAPRRKREETSGTQGSTFLLYGPKNCVLKRKFFL